MQRTLILFLTILALLIFSTAPKSHAMMMEKAANEVSTSEADSHCGKMDMAKQDNLPLSNKATNDCCDNCECLIASNSFFFSFAVSNATLSSAPNDLLINNPQTYYSSPAKEFFIPPKIS